MITPPQVHAQVDALVSAFVPPIIVVTEPGAHGDTIFGMHGCGARTPFAAEVAAATWGFSRLLHMPNVGMLLGATFVMVQAGVVAATVLGVALMTAGLVPIEHLS